MKPLSLLGHTRALTRVRINKDGDLLFTASKDNSPSVWYLENGERVGTYDGHKGAIWDIDVSWDSKFLVSSSADPSVKIWDVETGDQVDSRESDVVCRSISMSYSGNLVAFTTTEMLESKATLLIVDIRDADQMNGVTAIGQVFMEQSANCCVFSHLDDTITVGTTHGHLNQYDLRDLSDVSNFSHSHKQCIQDLQMSHDQCFLISSSSDRSAKLHDSHTLTPRKTYKHGRPVNSAAVSPTHEFIVLGGGEEARGVTQTSASAGQFEAKIYDMFFEDEFAFFKGHFGPINTLAYSPDGRVIVTGSEDGFVRIQEMDPDYFDYQKAFEI